MKVETTVETDGPNYDGPDQGNPLRGSTYSKRPVGTVIEGPDAWRLATSDVGVAKPIDDEATAKVAEAEKVLEQRRALFHPPKAKVTPPKVSKSHKSEK